MTGSLVVISKMRRAKQEGEELSEVPPASQRRQDCHLSRPHCEVHTPSYRSHSSHSAVDCSACHLLSLLGVCFSVFISLICEHRKARCVRVCVRAYLFTFDSVVDTVCCDSQSSHLPVSSSVTPTFVAPDRRSL